MTHVNLSSMTADDEFDEVWINKAYGITTTYSSGTEEPVDVRDPYPQSTAIERLPIRQEVQPVDAAIPRQRMRLATEPSAMTLAMGITKPSTNIVVTHNTRYAPREPGRRVDRALYLGEGAPAVPSGPLQGYSWPIRLVIVAIVGLGIGAFSPLTGMVVLLGGSCVVAVRATTHSAHRT